jgi:hypothetical protein
MFANNPDHFEFSRTPGSPQAQVEIFIKIIDVLYGMSKSSAS